MGVTATHEIGRVRKDDSAVDPYISNSSLPKSILVLFGTSEQRGNERAKCQFAREEGKRGS